YTFNVQPSGSTPPPPVIGTPLTLDSVVSQAISVAGERDVYTFTLAQPARLYFDTLTSTSTILWSLAGPAGAAVRNRPFNASDGATLSANPVLALPAGAYALTVAGSGSSTGAYQFRLWDLASAVAITPGTAFSGSLGPANETDLYRFAATAGDRFFFD